MEIHQLRYFVAVADEGNFSRAAAKVRVAQPSLSQQIRKLEAEVGQPLFDRLPRSVVLTEAGRCLIDYARQTGSRRNSDDCAVCAAGIGSDIPQTLSRGDAGDRRGCDPGNQSPRRSGRAGCRAGINLPTKSHPATRIAGQRTIACPGAGRPLFGKADLNNAGRSQVAAISASARDALPLATGESPA